MNKHIAYNMKEILLANIAMARFLLIPGKKPHPVLVSFESPLKKEHLAFGRAS